MSGQPGTFPGHPHAAKAAGCGFDVISSKRAGQHGDPCLSGGCQRAGEVAFSCRPSQRGCVRRQVCRTFAEQGCLGSCPVERDGPQWRVAQAAKQLVRFLQVPFNPPGFTEPGCGDHQFTPRQQAEEVHGSVEHCFARPFPGQQKLRNVAIPPGKSHFQGCPHELVTWNKWPMIRFGSFVNGEPCIVEAVLLHGRPCLKQEESRLGCVAALAR